uniref:Uncharacterized protein n=1 Tax=Tetradesmus obliquus TaxID=3088 RepID=A0A383WJC5_TETOB|eukprot:jgi/Sobl393_1/8231/SZX77224.1
MTSSSTAANVFDSDLPSAAAGAAAEAAQERHVPAGVLPSLQAAVFEGTVRGLDDIAALAPNVQELYCSKLMLPRRQQQQQQQDLNSASQLLRKLPQLTHFGSESVHVEAEDAADAAAAFAAVFPALQVLFRTPEFGGNLTLSDHIHKTKVPLREVLARCTALHSLRAFGSTTDMCGVIAQQLSGLQHIKRLSVYGIGPAVELKGLRQLTQLQQLQLTFELPAKRAALQLLQELLQLQQLQLLALPAKLLCRQCCPGLWEVVDELAGQCSSRGCKLVFLKRQQRPGPQAVQAGDFCRHPLVLEAGFRLQLTKSTLAAAAAARHALQLAELAAVAMLDRRTDAAGDAEKAASPPAQRLQLRDMQQQEEPQLPEHLLREGGRCSVWGLLGPAEDWWQ